MQPRAMVTDRAWRALGPGLEPLSGPDGAPLTRTVKLIVLPLVIRPTQRPELAGDLLDDDQATRFAELVAEARPVLVATARWFTVLKKTRRALGIVGGNPQDLYFQRCFELATGHGAPGDDHAGIAEDVLREIADTAGGLTVDALRAHLADPTRRAAMEAAVAAAWARRSPGTADPATAALAEEFLDNGSAAAFDTLVTDAHGSAAGCALWTGAGWDVPELPAHLGLTAHPAPRRPEVGFGASTATLPPPLDRTLFERIFTELQTSSVRREDLPPVPELARAEVGRSCAPFGLLEETLRVAMVLGGWLAAGLDPLGERATAGMTATHRAANRRWQREASALRARRMTTSPTGDGPLAVLARELRTPWVAYVRRLWVRLHGRDVRADPLPDAAAVVDVLDGVGRSVIMDHRGKVRAALRALSVAAPAAAESRIA